MSFNKHKCEKKIMQKIDKKLGIVYLKKLRSKPNDINSAISKKILDYLTCPSQGQAAELYSKRVYCS